MLLPMSWTSPLTVASTILPCALSTLESPSVSFSSSMNGSRYATARFMARALFTTCGQEHLPGAEQVADDLHAVHQRALDHLERAVVDLAGLLGVVLDEVDDAVDQRVREPLLHRALAPGEVVLAHDARRP